MAGERTRIGLWHPQVGLAGGRGGVHVHFALHVAPEDYDAAVERLREHGYEPELHDFDLYDESRAAYVTDPDGNVVELWTWDVARHLTR
jgi:catechol 2,3-dioxygenase-like lactoylglutathione lyase family enzyme